MIDWSAFSWEAFSTLITGILAVGAAVYVGRRQVEISDRQSRILEEQLRLEGLKYRSELFDRRFEVYEATARYLADILVKADEPDPGIKKRFLIAQDTAKFLFAPEVSKNLSLIWDESISFFTAKRGSESSFERSGSCDDGAGNTQWRQLDALNERLQNLSELFGDELRLSEKQGTVGIVARSDV